MTSTAASFTSTSAPFEGNLIKKNSIALDTSASSDVQENLAKFLQWQVSATKSCMEANKDYKLCRRFSRGSGSYCGTELTILYDCLKQG